MPGTTSTAYARPHRQLDTLTFGNDIVRVEYGPHTGTMDLFWHDGHKLLGIYSGAQLADGRTLSSAGYSSHVLEPSTATDRGEHDYVVRSSMAGMPDLIQHITLYDGKPWLTIQAELNGEAASVGTRHFDAVATKTPDAVQLGSGARLRVLHVPFDNDMWFRFNSMDVAAMKPEQAYSSAEVTTIFDNESRQALVLGSITHDVWKTAIDLHAANGQLKELDVYGGISSPTGVRTDTHDTVPHGIVHGRRITSPRIFIGSFSDWRDGLEAYARANAAIHPPLVWPAGAPMGWNSWAAYGDHINAHRYLGSAAFVRDNLVPQGFGRNGVVYINLDAFWSALDAVQLQDAVADIKAMHGANGIHFEPGIYWTPFAYWSDDLDAYVEGTNMKYRYRDILLKAPDGSFLPKVDGGRPIDPTHPGTKERTAYYIQHFKQLGFRYLKIDFLSHGALEGAHYDPTVQTGIEAYNMGMKEIVDQNAGQMFLSLSIAPLFPSGYGNARRLSCDTKGHINGAEQSTEYMLNALTYGWWTDKSLYIADPDHVVLGAKADQGARSVTEGKSRLLSAVISGGMILDSSRLADDPEGQAFARAVYDNPAIFAVASEGKIFRPLEGDTGDKATNVFVRPSAQGWYVAVFNYDDKQPQTVHIPLARIAAELKDASPTVKDLSGNARLSAEHGIVSVVLQSAESRLIEVQTRPS